jgi:hypothetical protein
MLRMLTLMMSTMTPAAPTHDNAAAAAALLLRNL